MKAASRATTTGAVDEGVPLGVVGDVDASLTALSARSSSTCRPSNLRVAAANQVSGVMPCERARRARRRWRYLGHPVMEGGAL